jgi:hypothetical protein
LNIIEIIWLSDDKSITSSQYSQKGIFATGLFPADLMIGGFGTMNRDRGCHNYQWKSKLASSAIIWRAAEVVSVNYVDD